MYDDIIDLAMDQQLLTEINTRSLNYKRLPVWKELHSKSSEEIRNLEKEMNKSSQLTFDKIFCEPIGYYFIKSYLESQHSVDKAIFIKDVEIFKNINDFDTRTEVSKKIFDTFCGPEKEDRIKGTSCLQNNKAAHLQAEQSTNKNNEMSISKSHQISINTMSKSQQTELSANNNVNINNNQKVNLSVSNTNNLTEHLTPSHEMENNETKIPLKSAINSNNFNFSHSDKLDKQSSTSHSDKTENDNKNSKGSTSGFFSDDSNAIGCYGKCVKKLRKKLELGVCDPNIFDEVLQQIESDLKLDVFPRFLKSPMYDMFLRCKSLELKKINISSFHPMRMLGRGAFGSVNACKKKDTGRLYAMKQIDKRRVQATDSVRSLICEKEFLSVMDSRFVTQLKYSFSDDDKIYLIMDLMTGGDLKYHLNHDGIFEENRARFYTAQILLGLQHIHSKGIIYRDLKLENILVSSDGHCKISDLGLAVSISDGLVRGYAGTPGYTAPEVVLTQYYTQQVDFFSLGVVIYRCLCGKKPFAKNKRDRNADHHGNNNDRARKTSIELDRNVVEMLPPFDNPRFSSSAKCIIKGLLNKNSKNRLGSNGFDEIKEHPWFDKIDWSLLEAGYLESPFIPPCDEIHAEQQQYIGRPPDDDKYSKIKITSEFNNSLKNFDFKSSKVIQSELVEVLNKVQYDRRQSKDISNLNINQLYAFPTPHEVAGKHHCLGGCVII